MVHMHTTEFDWFCPYVIEHKSRKAIIGNDRYMKIYLIVNISGRIPINMAFKLRNKIPVTKRKVVRFSNHGYCDTNYIIV